MNVDVLVPVVFLGILIGCFLFNAALDAWISAEEASTRSDVSPLAPQCASTTQSVYRTTPKVEPSEPTRDDIIAACEIPPDIQMMVDDVLRRADPIQIWELSPTARFDLVKALLRHEKARMART